MSFLDHIRACNNADPSRYWPFRVDGRALGAVRPGFAEQLRRFPDIFSVTDRNVSFAPGLDDANARSAAMERVGRILVAEGHLPKPRRELYAVAGAWGERPVFLLERKFVPAFGVRAYGVHINGFVRNGGEVKLWIGTRSAVKDVAPGKLDNMVAGGQPAGLGLMENVVKEGREEADVPPALAQRAKPAGLVSYLMEDEWGLKPDVLFIYDLEVPADFTPRNTDGEIDRFTLMDVGEVIERIRTTSDFKFNVNLVIIDFLIRHGLLSPDDEPDYAEIAAGLRRSV